MESENSSDQPAENAAEDPVGVMFTDALCNLDQASKAAILKFSKDFAGALAQLRLETNADISKMKEGFERRAVEGETKFVGIWTAIRKKLEEARGHTPDVAIVMYEEIFQSISALLDMPCAADESTLELSTRIFMGAIMERERNTRAAADLARLVRAGMEKGLHHARPDFEAWLAKFDNANT